MESNGEIILNKKNYLMVSFNNNSKKMLYHLFIETLFEYINSFKINIKEKNKKYSLRVIKKGISMLKNVMNILFLYTRNVDMIHKHLNKSFLYYIEFIEQIGEEGNTFLQLSSKDAVLFVYKKTLFDINTDYKKKMKLSVEESVEINSILDNLNLFVFITDYVMFNGIENIEDIDVSFIKTKINKIIDKYSKKSHVADLNNMTNDLFHYLVVNNLSIVNILTCTEAFLHKVNDVSYDTFKERLMKHVYKEGCNHNKFISSLIKI